MQYHYNLNLYILYRDQSHYVQRCFGQCALLLNVHVDLLNLLTLVAPPFWLNSAYNIYMIIRTSTFQFHDENILFPLDIVLHLVFNEHNICGGQRFGPLRNALCMFTSHFCGPLRCPKWKFWWMSTMHLITCTVPLVLLKPLYSLVLLALDFSEQIVLPNIRFFQSYKHLLHKRV